MERWALAQDGEGQVVLLSGEPGIGKSRILSALWERLEGQGAQVLQIPVFALPRNSALWPIIDNFERTLKFGRDEAAESRLDKLEALIVTHFGRPHPDVRFIASICPFHARSATERCQLHRRSTRTRRCARWWTCRSGRPQATQRDAVRGSALGRSHHARSRSTC